MRDSARLAIRRYERDPCSGGGPFGATEYSNRGIATQALSLLTPYAFATFDLRRLQASVFGWNPASGRVLEKC